MSTLLDQLETLPELDSELLTTIKQPCLFTMLDSQVEMYPEHIAVQDCDSSVLIC